jgi:hypothetical protein
MSKQPRDDGNAPIPVLGLLKHGGQVIDLSAVSAQQSTRFNASVRVITTYSTVDCFIELGDETITANLSNSHFLPAGYLCDFSLGFDNINNNNAKYLSVYSTDIGKLYISERI